MTSAAMLKVIMIVIALTFDYALYTVFMSLEMKVIMISLM